MNINCSEVDNFNISLSFYNSIKQIADDTLKYINNFKIITQEYQKKLISLNNNFGEKIKSCGDDKLFQIITLTEKLPNFINLNNEQYQSFLNISEQKIKNFENFLKEKSEIIKKYHKNFNDLNNELPKKYNELNKDKSNYLNSMSETESTLIKYYSTKSSIEKMENDIKNISDKKYSNLKEKMKNETNNKINSMKNTQKAENDYLKCDKDTTLLENKFIENSISLKNNIKDISCNISEEIKNIIIFFMESYNNCYKKCIEESENNKNLLKELNEIKLTEDIIKSEYKDFPILKHPQICKYNLKSFTMENEQTKKSNNLPKRKKTITTLEDGFNQMKFFSDEATFYTIKEILDNFKLIENNNDFILEKEQNKHLTKKLIEKILNNISPKILTWDDNPETLSSLNVKEISNDELKQIENLLNEHENRVIFLQKLSDYRANGNFIIQEKDYNLIGNLLNIICGTIRRDLDYHSAELTIILSDTYYVEEKNGNKKYLHCAIRKNELFKEKQFWEEFITYSINKEIMKTMDRDDKIKEGKKCSDYKISNIVFASLITLINNMISYGVETNDLKEIINSKITFYKLNDEFKNIIYNVIEEKGKEMELKKEEETKK